MSYVPSRDNPALAGVNEATWDRLELLVDEVDESSYPGQHQDACACDDPDCRILANIRIGNGASSLEVLGYAAAKGLLHLDLLPARPPWTPEVGDWVTGTSRKPGRADPVGAFISSTDSAAVIAVEPHAGGRRSLAYVDADTLRPAGAR